MGAPVLLGGLMADEGNCSTLTSFCMHATFCYSPGEETWS